jgi:exopolyphosphatase/guanosine-5'-triphosphate,3'-diphosphate pyrophosphatase
VSAAGDDRDEVAGLLGRPPMGRCVVVVRDSDGRPLVIRNHPLLDDGTPMPTLYWLVGEGARSAVGRLEAAGGVSAAQAAVDAAELTRAHATYQAERDAAMPAAWSGPRPSGGVGGTRTGVKCLHAHYAWYLAGGDDPVGRWVAERLAPPASAVAAVDCGTNSTRLLVAGPDGETLARLMTITRLGRGVDASGRLSADAIARTVEVLAGYRKVMDDHRVRGVKAVATSAVRDAGNGAEFLSAAAAVLGTRPAVLSGGEEGRLSFAGATATLDPARGPFAVLDIGGGSTELVVGGAGGQAGDHRAGDERGLVARSVNVGCVRVTERWLRSDPPSRADLDEARLQVRDLMQGAVEATGATRARTLVGLAGTVSAAAVLDLGLDSYRRDLVHHHLLGRASVEELLEQLARIPSAERATRKGVEPDRADVIVGGLVVLAVSMELLGARECLVSESDILDGLAGELLAPRLGA